MANDNGAHTETQSRTTTLTCICNSQASFNLNSILDKTSPVITSKPNATMSTKGPNFTPIEDLMLAMAFIKGSEDPTVGTDQKSVDFKSKMFEFYCRLIDEHNGKFGTSYQYRQGHSNYLRFKKISKFTLKFIGIEEAAGDPPTGDNDRAEWEKNVKETYCERHPDGKNILESVLNCKDFLQESPKWRPFEESSDRASKRTKRPMGSKKSKQMKQDLEVIKKITGNTKTQKKRDKSMQKHQKAQQEFMNGATSGMAALAAVLSEQNDVKLLDCMTPTTRNEMAKKMLNLKMKKLMMSSKRKANEIVTVASSSDSEKSDNGDSSSNEDGMVTPTPARAHARKQQQEDVDSDEIPDSDDDSPGDNRVRSPGGTLRLPPEHLVRKYQAPQDSDNDSDSN
jgi:hypothetical protein